jgi:hypothetical protein
MRTGLLKDLLEVVLGRSGAPLEIAFGCHRALFVGVIDLLIAIVGHRSEVTWMVLLPLLPTLSALLVLLTVVLVGVMRPLPVAASALTKVKAAPTTSSPEVCWVAMSSNTLVVFCYSRPSSWTKEWHVVPSQKAEMMSASATLGSS